MKKKNYETLGVMLDMSRNAVMSVESLKTYFGYLKKMGYNCVMLYTEDTYEVDGEPYLGYMRGRYSVEEMREIDEYAQSDILQLVSTEHLSNLGQGSAALDMASGCPYAAFCSLVSLRYYCCERRKKSLDAVSH